MANSFLTNEIITQETLRRLENHMVMGKFVNRTYDKYFANTGAKIGDTLSVRVPQHFAGRTGRNVNLENLSDRTVAIKVDTQAGVDMIVTSADLALDIDDFGNRYLDSAVSTIANRIDAELLKLYNQIPNFVGDPAAPATNLLTYLKAGAKLDSEGAPLGANRAVVIGPYTQAGLVDQLKGLFQSSVQISEQYEKGTMGIAAGFKFSMDQNVQNHFFGSGVDDPIQINGANQSGSTLTIKGLVGELKKGDSFNIAGVYHVNTASKQSSNKLRDFIVTEDAAAGATSIKIAPAITLTGAEQNVTALPANNANVTFVGSVGGVSEQGLAFHRDAFALVCVDLPLPKGVDKGVRMSDDQMGISIRLVSDYDVMTDTFVTRLDVLFGVAVLRPELAVRVMSNPTTI